MNITHYLRLSNITIYLVILSAQLSTFAQTSLTLSDAAIQITWKKGNAGYQVNRVSVRKDGKLTYLNFPSGEYTILYSATKPDSVPLLDQVDAHAKTFPEPIYKYIINTWHENLKPVPMNTAGTALHFFPEQGTKSGQEIVFMHQAKQASLQATWKLDTQYPGDLLVSMQLTAQQAGYFSLSTPTLATISEKDLRWGIIPGHLQGISLQDDLVLSYAYGQGIPRRPIVVRDRTATTLAPLFSQKNGLTLAVIPQPGTSRDPWQQDHNTHSDWQLGLSLMNRKGQLTPTAYHPVLGEKGSYLKAGESLTFSFRYSLQASDWYTVYKHAIYDIYHFRDFLSLKQTRQSLTSRIESMHRYVNSDSTSLWRTEQFNGQTIGAQAYLGGVVGSDKDAMKNSDYGAMWMLTTVTGDSLLNKTRLPYARNFKLMQQQSEPGFFQGAAVGQYYLSKSHRFTEEWGPYVEPIGLTYYTMLDMGNILLFEPNDTELKERLRQGAERLLSWQYPDGHWEVAYDRQSEKPRFTELQDLRPTFYGLLVAYRILGDERYLFAARKGADWFIHNATERGNFLGVCGDLRFVPDFATGQSVQALLDLFDITGDNRYKTAALQTARIYTASIYTHPIPTKEIKNVNGTTHQDWEISQVGLSFEHGGSIGSANMHGPIPLASHAGMFIRLFAITQDSLFLDMARAAAWGRDAFVHQPTGVASYYWRTMNAGAGPYPHHAWWQIGWITDYLLSEVSLRSEGKITFPRGFITPKVGPHQTYGFANGKIFGQLTRLYMPDGLIQVDDPQVDYWTATAVQTPRIFVLLLNNDDQAKTSTLKLNSQKILRNGQATIRSVELWDAKGKQIKQLDTSGKWNVSVPAFGLTIAVIDYESNPTNR
ncbi:beta-L-arabinofuranosidase domain-containing protein [Xanthocytophaga agilis]|uniref:Glycoside hydrolase family 127 protein n=1 Tax=Xanthocytophaga agilis TaxID=3048010 RepID=A0AAE3UIV6_9BACT|nr:beta-L-arabinofuranosidase domain-containing protein [Xanthocytophaga agilis]MDJ1504198.1 glycoside hydrolase family 127 protein [Xanthocytophaga agilis]